MSKIDVNGIPSIQGHSETLKDYILPINHPLIMNMVGKEKSIKTVDNIEVYKSVFNSFRYLFKLNNEFIACIQVVKKDKDYILSNIYTIPEHRQKGIATILLNQVKKDFRNIKVSHHLTEDGAKFFHITKINN